jgi:hypothetical protein
LQWSSSSTTTVIQRRLAITSAHDWRHCLCHLFEASVFLIVLADVCRHAAEPALLLLLLLLLLLSACGNLWWWLRHMMCG